MPEDNTQNPTPGSGDGAGGGAGNGEDQAGRKKEMSQEDIDRIVKDRLDRERGKFKVREQELLTTLQTLEADKNTSASAREELQKQIAELEEKVLSKEELAAKREKDAKAQAEKEILATKADKDRYQTLLVDNVRSQALTRAAVKCEAYDVDQVVALLSNRVEVAEVLGEGRKPTGKFKLTLRLPAKDDDGNDIEEAFDVDKGVEEYLNRNPNLVRANVAGGAGTTPGGVKDASGRTIWYEEDIGKMSSEEYSKHEAEILLAGIEGRVRPGSRVRGV